MPRLGRISERLLVALAVLLLILTLGAPWAWQGTAKRVSTRPTLAKPTADKVGHKKRSSRSVLQTPKDEPLLAAEPQRPTIEPPVANNVALPVEVPAPDHLAHDPLVEGEDPSTDEQDVSLDDNSILKRIANLASAMTSFLPDRFPAIKPIAPVRSMDELPEEPSPLQQEPEVTEPDVTEEPAAAEETLPSIDPIAQRRALAVSPWAWPQSLVDQTRGVASLPGGESWCHSLDAALIELVRSRDAETQKALRSLTQLAKEARGWSEQTSAYPDRAAWLRASFCITRRIEVWQAGLNTINHAQSLADATVAAHELKAIEEHLRTIPNGERWFSSLSLDKAALAAKANDRRALSVAWTNIAERIRPDKLNSAQAKFLELEPLASFTARVRGFVGVEKRIADVFAAVENVENTESSVEGKRLARLVQNEYRLATRGSTTNEVPADSLPAELTTYYRNANFRVAVSRVFVDRFLPQPQPMQQNVRDEIRGAKVTGTGTASTQLSLVLMPDSERWRLAICGNGSVQTATSSNKGIVTLVNDGFGEFMTQKFIVIDRQGMQVSRAVARANSSAQLRDLETSLDGIPLISSVVRLIAKNQYEQQKVEAQGEMDQKMASRISNQFENEVNSRLANFEHQFQTQWLKKIEDLGVAPRPLELETTEQRLIARWRFAGSDQLSGHTPRPQAPADSLVSVQIHQSLANNLAQGLKLNGRKTTVPELYAELANRFGFKQGELSDEIPEDLVFTFADDEPLRIDFIEGRARMTIKLKELVFEEDGPWRHLTVRAWYKPADNQEEANLVRDGIVELAGERLAIGDQVVLRSLFARVFSTSRPVSILNRQLAQRPKLADLQVTQLDMIDGWCGIALGPKNVGANTARRPLHTSTRK